MSAAAALIDAALTIRVWQRAGLAAADIGRQIGCARNWNAVEAAIVVDLLMRDVPARLAA